jgi:hypothetical protein
LPTTTGEGEGEGEGEVSARGVEGGEERGAWLTQCGMVVGSDVGSGVTLKGSM